MAETTTTTSLSCVAALMMSATFSIQHASLTDVPPNFITRSSFLAFPRTLLGTTRGGRTCAGHGSEVTAERLTEPARFRRGFVIGGGVAPSKKRAPGFVESTNPLACGGRAHRRESILVYPTAHRDRPIAKMGSPDLGSIPAGRGQSCCPQ